jgi:hypothetical protein
VLLSFLISGPANCSFFFSVIVIGFCSWFHKFNVFPGLHRCSWGYHGDDGCFYKEGGEGESYSETFGMGDVIGCYITADGDLSFTKNGISLGKMIYFGFFNSYL